MPAKTKIPDYQTMLGAYHRGFYRELKAMVDSLPIQPGQTVLDMACGDGVYSPMLAEHVGKSGRVVAVDLLPAYLNLAREEAAKSPLAEIIEFSAAPIEELPYADGTFDLAWCAQSFYSLDDPVESLEYLLRVTKPGGVVAVLEADTIHHVILPWPVEVELSVRAAELRALADDVENPRKYYVGRKLLEIFRKAGLVDITTKTWATDRAYPLGEDERTFFAEYLDRIKERVDDEFDGKRREQFDRLTDPNSKSYMLDDPDLTITCIDHITWGRKPG